MIAFGDCTLRLLKEDDLVTVFQWRNRDAIRRVMFSEEKISWQDHVTWYHRMTQSEQQHLLFMFELRGSPMGFISFTQMDHRHKRCFWGFYVGEENAPGGTGSAMGYLALDHIFSNTNIRKVTGEVLSTNVRSSRYHEKMGFRKEGELREHIYKEQQFMNVEVYGLLKMEWELSRDVLRSQIFV